jgi:hypothetical protein
MNREFTAMEAEVHSEIHTRWRQMFTTLLAGSDLPPTQRLRTEGLMEAITLLGALAPERVQEQMDTVYREVFGRSLAEDFGVQWRDFFPFPQIPAMSARAPVYPSTAD